MHNFLIELSSNCLSVWVWVLDLAIKGIPLTNSLVLIVFPSQLYSTEHLYMMYV